MTSVDDVDEDETKMELLTEQEKHATNVKGAWVRPSSKFHDQITVEESKFTAEKDRYHLYYSDACPWYVLQSIIVDDPEMNLEIQSIF